MLLVKVKYYLLIFCFWGFTSLKLLSAQESLVNSFFNFKDVYISIGMTVNEVRVISEDYTFIIKGNKIRSETFMEQSVNVSTKQAWYKTVWAYLGYIIFITVGVYTLHLGQVNRKLADKEAKRLKAVDKLKTRFYTNITHEFRTPLTVILGMAHQIKDEPQTWVEDGVEMILRNANRLLELVNQILNLNKLESDLLRVSYQQSDIVEYSKYLIDSFNANAKAKNIQIHFYCEEDSIIMDFDPENIQLLFTNLISNAIKFTPGGGNIYVDLARKKQKLKLTIRDTGSGISKKHLPYFFNRFYQLGTDTSQSIEGTGIGLALVRKISRLIGAEIHVKSRIGKGLRFDIIIPIHNDAETGVMPIGNKNINSHNKSENIVFDIRELQGDERGTKPLILIIEGSRDLMSYLSSCLTPEYRIILAMDGEEGISKAIAFVPDLIISDLMIPVKDGFEICDTLKNDILTSHIPIIMIAAKSGMQSRLEGISKGADVYLEKPFNRKELELWIRKLLDLRENLKLHYLESAGITGPDNLSYPESGFQKTKNSFLNTARQIVEKNVAESDFNVSRLCEDLNVSHSQLHRKLTALTGLSAQKFIRKFRLAKAKDLLLNEDLCITEVCFDCGFNDPNYFSRVFRQHIGLTPSEWRKKYCKSSERFS